MLVVCAYCDRQRVGGVWLPSLPPPESEMVSHGMCDECYHTQMIEWGYEEAPDNDD